MLPPVTPSQFPALAALASGPFSYRYQTHRKLIAELTEYPAPDGGWEWATCPASFWTPELSGYPPSKNT